MPDGHRIRLRGAWDVSPLPDGRVRHARRFGHPRTLDPGERAFLTCDSLPALATVSVNGTVVGHPDGAFEIDITSAMQLRNEVTIDIPDGAAVGEVALVFRMRV